MIVSTLSKYAKKHVESQWVFQGNVFAILKKATRPAISAKTNKQTNKQKKNKTIRKNKLKKKRNRPTMGREEAAK